MIGRRAFATKLIKDSNVDIRQRLAKILDSASSSPALNNETSCPTLKETTANLAYHGESSYIISYYCDTPINDLVDPVDYEEFIEKNISRIPHNLQHIILFPIDDINVEKYQPSLRTLESSSPEFNNLQTSEDPYIQSIGSCNSKSLVIVKKYEKHSSITGLFNERQSQAKELKRQDYEIDLSSNLNDDEDNYSELESGTPSTFYSRQTSVRNTPRPRSLVSTSSTIRPPLASDEEDFTDEDDKSNEAVSIVDYDKLYTCDISSNDTLNKKIINTDSRNSWIYTDSTCNIDPLNIFGSKTKSLCSLENSQSDPHIQGILENNFYDNFFDISRIYFGSNNQDQQIVPLFVLHNLQLEEEQIECRPIISVPSDVPRYRLLLKCLSLKLDLCIEPIFANIAIYDAKERKKVTENFYFDMNPESLKRLLRSHIAYQDLSTLSRSAIFSLSQLTPDMYFVIKLEKVLQGDINDIIDAYSRPSDDTNKIEKLKVLSAANCERLGRYRMPFAWTAFPLVDILSSGQLTTDNENVIKENETFQSRNNSSSLDSLKRIANECTSNFVRKGSLERHSTLASTISNFSTSSASSSHTAQTNLDKRFSMTSKELLVAFSNFKPVTITSKIFYRNDGDKFSDDDLYKFLQEFKRPSFNNKRMRYIPGTLKIDISSIIDESLVKCRVNPELVRLHPYTDDRLSPIKELLEFRDLRIPHIEHRNLIYIYPKSLNFTNRQGSARNISIKIQLLSSEENFSAMPVIFGKSSCPEMLKESYTSINYHNRNPNFNEEFKIRLPSKISKQTHLFFTFIHVHTKHKSESPVDEIVGYTWLPLWRDDCLQTGLFSLPVLAELPTAGYSFLTPNSYSHPNMKWIDNHKPLFVVQLDSYSSIFTQDPCVDRFFRITTSLDSQAPTASYLHSTNLYEEYSSAVSGLASSKIDSLIKFVHIILNRLILLLVRPPQIFSNQNKSSPTLMNSFQTLIFETIILVVNKINSSLDDDYSGARSNILSTFIHYQAIFPQPEIRYINEEILPNNLRAKSTTENNAQSNQTEYVCRMFHEEIIEQWMSANDSFKEKIYENSSFLFDIIFKSLCVHLSLNNRLPLPPRKRANKQFLNKLSQLICVIGDYVVLMVKNNALDLSTPSSPQSPTCQTLNFFQNLNQSIAFFIRDLLSIVDRYFVFNLIKNYIHKLSSDISISSNFPYNSTNSTSDTSRSFSDGLFELRVDFLRVVCGHEHFISLNLPIGTPLFSALEQNVSNTNNSSFSPSSSFAKVMLNSSIFSQSIFDRIRPYAELTDDYRRQHWLLGLVFCTVVESFTRPNYQLQSRAANLIRSILTSLDWDPRYKDTEIKSRIACLYFPLIGVIIDVISQLHDPNEPKNNAFYSVEENKKYKKQSIGLSKPHNKESVSPNESSPFIDNSIAMAIAGSVVNGSSKSPDSTNSSFNISNPSSPQNYRHTLTYQKINEKTTRILIACFLWVLGNIDQRLFRLYLNEFSNERLLTFLEILRLSMRIFEYEGEKSFQKNPRAHFRRESCQKLQVVIPFGTARRDLMRRRDFSQSFGSSDCSEIKRRWRKDSTPSRYNSLNRSAKVDVKEEVILEGYLCTMISLITIDSLTQILSIFRERIFRPSIVSSLSVSNLNCCNLKNKYGSNEFVVGSTLKALLQLLSLNQSTYVLEAAFECQRAFLFHFPNILFIEGLSGVEFCSELCNLLLKHCGSRVAVVRAQASASMYLLMRQNYQLTENFSRIKIQITMSLSQLVGTSHSFNEIYIRRALKSILTYAIVDATVRSTQFPEQVRELISNLNMILSDTMQMKKHEKDSEMLLDLMYRVAKGYQNSPELRLTWLQNMAKKHTELSQHTEAAQCYIHGAALVSERLHKISRRTYLPVSCIAFQRVCPNVFEENTNSNADVSTEKPIVCSTEDTKFDSNKTVQSANLFNEPGLVSLLEEAAESFNYGGMFEAVNETYKLLIPIHEAHHRYPELAKAHKRLHDIFVDIEKHEGKRVFATYFRVGFYGELFGDLDQEEFVYKEPFLTKLPEISHRLEEFYSRKFGPENVQVIKDSNPVDVTNLDAQKAYIQITYVEPYFDSWELDSRSTSYERNYNIKRFIFSTPFTFDGRAHGKLYEQCKRKTIITTEHAFPYVKTRVLVQDRHQLVLSPIEVAIEDLQKKTNELAHATHQEPVDAKILQMVLQGCVGTTVNQGPAEIAFVFLSDEPNIPSNVQRPPQSLQNKLRIAFKEFSARCGEALTKNRLLVNNNEQQVEYHKELERNFYKFTERLAPLMGKPNSNQALLLLRESYISGFKTPSNTLNNVDTNRRSSNGILNGVNSFPRNK